MPIMDKIKSLFSGGSSTGSHDHSGHDHAGHDHDHPHEPSAPMPPTDPAGMPTGEADEDRPA